MTTIYRCPTDCPAPTGCGHVFTVEYDQPWQDGNDDCVDCPNCGLFWPFAMYHACPVCHGPAEVTASGAWTCREHGSSHWRTEPIAPLP